MSSFFTWREQVFFVLFICLEITIFFIDTARERVEAPRPTYSFVRGPHSDRCWMYETSNLLGKWDNDGELWKPPGFTSGPTYQAFPGGNGTEFVPGSTVVVRRWDIFNPYEMMHAMFNFYVITKHLRMDRPVVIFKDRWSGDGGAHGDMVMWKTLSRHVLTGDLDKYRFENAVYIGTPSKCIINAIPMNMPAGVCPVELYKEFTRDVAKMLGAAGRVSNPKIRVLWSSRRPYWRNGAIRNVNRMVPDEEKFLNVLRVALGGRYQVLSYDFGNFTHDESIRAALQGDIMVGVHGAGLQWSAWLPQEAPLVEIFGGDRGPSNIHYKNMAKAQGRPYKSCNWGDLHKWKIECVVKSIKSFKEYKLQFDV